MSFSENLQFLRKKKNMTQEQFAEKLEVSRQSVSKWESGVTYPEMDKILQICQMFHCNMDDLMQGDISRVFVEDKAGYDKFQNKFSWMITVGVGLILLGVSVINLMEAFGGIEAIRNMVFFAFVMAGIMILILAGMQRTWFKRKNPFIEDFYTEEEKDIQYKKFTVRMVVGVGLIFFSVILLIGSEALPAIADFSAEQMEEMVQGIFLFLIMTAVCTIVYGGMQKSKYNIREYNAEKPDDDENASPDQKKRNTLVDKLCGCIMLVAVICFFVLGFVWNRWDISWIAYPIGGILCAIVSIALGKDYE